MNDITKRGGWTEKLALGSRIFTALYFLDIILLGTGALTRVGMFSTRILFFAGAVVLALPLIFIRLRELLRDRYLLAVVAFLLWLCVALFIGLRAGNRRDIIRSDLFGYMNLLLLPAMLCTFTERRQFERLGRLIVGALLVIAAATVVLSFYAFFPNKEAVYSFINESGLGMLTPMAGNATRVFLQGGLRYCLVGYLFSLYFFLTGEGKKKYVWTAFMALFVTAIFLSYTRSVYLGCFLAVVTVFFAVLFKKRDSLKGLLVAVLVSGAAACVLVGALSAVQHENLFGSAFYRIKVSVTEVDEGEADDFLDSDAEQSSLLYRGEIIKALLDSFKKSPIAGNGLGAAINYSDGYVEYSYYDILNKTGVVGLALFILPFALMCAAFCKRKKGGGADTLLCAALLGSVFYFLVIAYFNPCMNTTTGLSCYILGLGAFSALKPAAAGEKNNG